MQYILPKILVGQQYACYGVAVNHIAKVKNDGDIVNTTRINVFSKLNDRLLLGTLALLHCKFVLGLDLMNK